MKSGRGRARCSWLPVLGELGWSFFRVSFLFFWLFLFFFFVTVNSVNMAAKGLISRLLVLWN